MLAGCGSFTWKAVINMSITVHHSVQISPELRNWQLIGNGRIKPIRKVDWTLKKRFVGLCWGANFTKMRSYGETISSVLAMMTVATWLSSSVLIRAAPQQRAPDFPPASLIELTVASRKVCVDETGVTEDSIARFNNEPEVFDDDERLKCYMDCMFRQFNVTKPDTGDVDMIELYHAIPKEYNSVTLKVYNKCRDVVEGSTLCERAFSHHKCWKRNDPVVSNSAILPVVLQQAEGDKVEQFVWNLFFCSTITCFELTAGGKYVAEWWI